MPQQTNPEPQRPINRPQKTFATVSFYVDDPNFKETLSPEEQRRLFTPAACASCPDPPHIFRYCTYFSDSPQAPPKDRGSSGDIWSSGSPGSASHSSGLQHYVKFPGRWLKVEQTSEERILHPFLPNVYLLERFWGCDTHDGRQLGGSKSPSPSGNRLKRARTESSPKAGNIAACRSQRKFWESDGNTVIRVEDALFKLHRSKLAKQSPLLKQLIQEKLSQYEEQSADTKPTPLDVVECCPVISLGSTGVQAKDFEELLGAIENAYPYSLQPPPFSSLASILQASHILQFTQIESWARRTIIGAYSSDLDKVSSTRLSDPLLAVQLTRSCNVPEIQARAFYELACSPRFSLASENVKPVAVDGRDREGPFASLPIHPDDLLKVISIREKLQLLWISETTEEDYRLRRDTTCPLYPKPSQSQNPDASSSATAAGCFSDAERRLHWATTIVECGVFDIGLLDPIEGARLLSQMSKWRKYCDPCAKLQRDIWMRVREKIWEKLHDFFQVSDEGIEGVERC